MPTRIQYTNKDFFYTITPESAYWLGFIYADGYLYKGVDKRHNGKYFRQELVIKLSTKDKEHLQQFSDIFNIPIKDRVEKLNSGKYNGRSYEKVVCRISDPYIIKPLFDMGLKDKTLNFDPTMFDLIPSSCLSHFIRGIFDGDGCITLHKKSKNTRGSIEITMGNKLVLEKINDLIIKDSGISSGKIRKLRENCYHLDWIRINDVCKLYKYMYKDLDISHTLVRKLNIFKELFDNRSIKNLEI